MLRQSSLLFLAFAVLSAPWVGVGASEWLLGRSVGMGLQFAMLAALASTLLILLRRAEAVSFPASSWLLLALSWTALGSLASWRLDSMGLAGESPWSKSLKQLVVLLLFLGCYAAPILLRPRGREWRLLERALALGLLCASVYGLLQAIHFHLPIPGVAALERWCSSNSSIASGSHELYLGHRFVGIARIRAGACEPLYFGSYLLGAVPLCAASALGREGFARLWRLIAAGLGGVALVLTFSRGVYAAAALWLLLLAWGHRQGRWQLRRPGWPLLAGLGVAAVLLLSAFTQVAPWQLPLLLVERVAQSFQSHDMSNLTRVYGWRTALAALAESPLLGIGWGDFGFHYYRLAPPGGGGAHFGWPMTNSLPLRFLAETGLIGGMLWAGAFWPTIRAAFRKGSDSRSFLFASLCIASLLQLLSSSQLQLPHLWLLAGFSALSSRVEGPVV